MNRTITSVCVRLAGAPADDRQCTSAEDASDSHPGILGNERRTRLPVSIADLIELGRGLDIEVEIAGRLYVSQPALILKDGPLLRSALCKGVPYKVGGASVFFYLDDP